MSNGAEPLARRWIVQGRVQGVGFRWFVQTKARSLGLGGWARNLEDGSVEVVASGLPRGLDAFEQELRKGPPGAHVTSLEISNVPHDGVDANSFIIKR